LTLRQYENEIKQHLERMGIDKPGALIRRKKVLVKEFRNDGFNARTAAITLYRLYNLTK
jgi:hypothetical protein